MPQFIEVPTAPPNLTLVATPASAGRSNFAAHVRRGLTATPKWLPCIYFYDEAGSQLFERICTLPEYYPTRTEAAILAAHADALAAHVGHAVDLVELGSGSATKTRLLVEALLRRHGRLRFVPIDISRSILEESSLALAAAYGNLTIHAVAGAYEDGLGYLHSEGGPPRLILWLGSNVGNFARADAVAFLRRLRAATRPEDHLLLGIDLRKEAATLIAAYDDGAGVTAAFNRNLLVRVNRELGGRFDLDRFAHQARWNEAEGRVEMHLVSAGAQDVAIDGLELRVDFADGESIHTENAYKYSLDEIEALAAAAGFAVAGRWLDAAARFSVNLWQPG